MPTKKHIDFDGAIVLAAIFFAEWQKNFADVQIHKVIDVAESPSFFLIRTKIDRDIST
jgi:hypothetical protein